MKPAIIWCISQDKALYHVFNPSLMLAVHRFLCHREVSGESMQSSRFTFIDLFAGIGGLRLAFEPFGGRCVFSSEWDTYSVQTYEKNFCDNRRVQGDIKAIHEDAIPDHDLLLAGFPCQPFSIAGVSKKNSLGRLHGFDDETQGTLFFDVLRILRRKRPAAFVLENVKNLTSHDGGRTFGVIMRNLQGPEFLGYNVTAQVIDAQHFLPQHRQRIVIVGFREDVGFLRWFGKTEQPG